MAEFATEPPHVIDVPASLPPTASHPALSAGLFRVLWRWHFYAGMIVGPVLFVMALTGALYLFKDEIADWAYYRLNHVVVQGARRPLNEQVERAASAIQQSAPELVPWRITVSPPEDLSTQVTFRGGQPVRFLQVFVDPYSARVLGTTDFEGGLASFFMTVLMIHREFGAGTIGRVISELTTCWTIILLITGISLWWPRSWTRSKGVWIPRWRVKLYTRLRDLHAISGAVLLPVFVCITVTGLWYTVFLGTNFQWIAENVEHGKLPFVITEVNNTNRSQKEDVEKYEPREFADWPTGQLEALVALAQKKYPDKQVYLSLENHVPGKAEGGAFTPEGTAGPLFLESFTVDLASQTITETENLARQSITHWWRMWNYPLHVGSVLGLFTKLIWFIAALALMLLPMTGLWMWWERRPTKTWGLPRHPEVKIPRSLTGVILLLCALMPLAGASVAVILVGDWIYHRMRN